jgi:hypothetical protein
VETITFNNITFTVWDIGVLIVLPLPCTLSSSNPPPFSSLFLLQTLSQGQDKIRSLWNHYYAGTDGLIFVVDSADIPRVDEAAMELHKVLREEELEKIPLLVLANKQDLPSAFPRDELATRLSLHAIKGREWYIQETTGTTGEGLKEAFGWLAEAYKR